MAIKKTHEEYVAEVAKLYPNIEIVGKYVKSNIKITHRCKIDGYVWDTRPNTILMGHGCPKCSGRVIVPHDEYVKKVFDINPNIEVIGIYKGARDKIMHRCKIDGYEWEITPDHILRGIGCPLCGGTLRKTHKQYVQEVSNINPNIEVLGEYIAYKTPILHRCKIDGCEWYACPSNILFGTGCPQCKSSRGEREIFNWLNNNSIIFEQQKTFDGCKNKKLLPFDFYLPQYNTCIEYDGEQHYYPINFFGGEERLKKNIQRDEIKTNYCFVNNIRLLRIRYDENIIEALEKFLGEMKINEGGNMKCLNLKSS